MIMSVKHDFMGETIAKPICADSGKCVWNIIMQNQLGGSAFFWANYETISRR
jgi:hypothetical protein